MPDEIKVKFKDKEYSLPVLQAMGIEELLTLRNLVAENLGAARVNGFKDHATAVTAAAAALKKYGEEVDAEKAGAPAPETKAGKAPKEPKAPVEKAPRPTPKCYSAETVKRPSRRMFGRIKKIGIPGKDQRPFAYDMFTDGQRLIDIKEDPNLHAGKISFWMRQKPPLIALEDISDEQFNKEMDEWYKKHGFQNPNASKEAKAKEKAEATAKLKAEKEAKAKEAAEKKAAEAAEKAKAKATKDAEKAEKAAAAEAKKKADAEAATKALAEKTAKENAAKAPAAAKA